MRLHQQERTQLWEIKPVYLKHILSRKRCFLDPRGTGLCQVHIFCIGTGLTSASRGSSHVLSWIWAPCLLWDLGPASLQTSLWCSSPSCVQCTGHATSSPCPCFSSAWNALPRGHSGSSITSSPLVFSVVLGLFCCVQAFSSCGKWGAAL